jgi:hypothetical protein
MTLSLARRGGRRPRDAGRLDSISIGASAKVLATAWEVNRGVDLERFTPALQQRGEPPLYYPSKDDSHAGAYEPDAPASESTVLAGIHSLARRNPPVEPLLLSHPRLGQ